MLATPLIAVILGALTVSAQKSTTCRLPGTKGTSKVKNKATCLRSVRTDNIDDPKYGLQVKTLNNWGSGNIPPQLRGIFYFEGNPYPAECFSTAAAIWNSSTKTTDLQMFAPKVWSSDDGANQLKRNLDAGAVFQTNCTTNVFNRLSCFTQEWDASNNKISHDGDYTSTEIADNHWIRGSNVRDVPFLGTQPIYPGTNISLLRYTYHMYRIVDENGQRTSRWDSNYIPNINQTVGRTGQINVHLGVWQEVPQAK